MKPWQRIINNCAVHADKQNIWPAWGEDGIPRCDEGCAHHDGKRCELIGFSTPDICEIAVAEMARMFDDASVRPTEEKKAG